MKFVGLFIAALLVSSATFLSAQNPGKIEPKTIVSALELLRKKTEAEGSFFVKSDGPIPLLRLREMASVGLSEGGAFPEGEVQFQMAWEPDFKTDVISLASVSFLALARENSSRLG